MVIIEVPLVLSGNGVIVYPDNLNLFGHTLVLGGNLVGQYNGVMVFPIFGGTFPPVPATVYKTEFLPLEFLQQLTAAEVQGIVSNVDLTIRAYVDARLQMRDLMIEPGDTGFIAFVNELETQTIVDVPRRDILLLGVPI